TKEERDAGQATEIVSRQLRVALAGVAPAQCARLTVAYEPVWAIGTGAAASAQDAANMARAIRTDLDTLVPSDLAKIRILYGGSTNAGNAGDFLAAADIDGLLVGGASLSADTFTSMIETAAHTS